VPRRRVFGGNRPAVGKDADMPFRNAAAAPTGTEVRRLLPLLGAALLTPFAALLLPDAPLLVPLLAAGPMFLLARWTREDWPPLAIVAVVPALVRWLLMTSAYPAVIATRYPLGPTGAALAALAQVLFVGGAAWWGARRRSAGSRSFVRRDGALALAAAAGASGWWFYSLSPFVAPVLLALVLYALARRTAEPWPRLAIAGLAAATAPLIVGALRWAIEVAPELADLSPVRPRLVAAIVVAEYLVLGVAAAWFGARRGPRRA
jgi:hypothetical protein